MSSFFMAKDSFEIVRCAACDLLYVDPRPAPEELAAFYNQPAYYSDNDLGYEDYFAEEQGLRAQARQRLAVIETLDVRREHLLDLGCAAGFFLDEARRAGWAVAGTELSQPMRQHCEQHLGLEISESSDAFAPESFDVITMWEYIEHLIDPLQELHAIRPLLAPGGVIAISTPNTAHLQVDKAPRDWWEFKPPAHLTFFTATTLRRLVEMAGYEVLRVDLHTPRVPASGAATFHQLERLHQVTGDRLERKTPAWWLYSLLRNLMLRGGAALLSKEKFCVGLDLYARKPG
jgi:2-polyprenyl-3-methyl-5-hydroxy-6-metoxy-1,4-benzoquinol methylase